MALKNLLFFSGNDKKMPSDNTIAYILSIICFKYNHSLTIIKLTPGV